MASVDRAPETGTRLQRSQPRSSQSKALYVSGFIHITSSYSVLTRADEFHNNSLDNYYENMFKTIEVFQTIEI